MSADPPGSPTDPERHRHWITDVQITTGRTEPDCKFSARIFVDDDLVCNLPEIDSTPLLRWSGLLLCHISPSSTLTFRLCKSVRNRPRYFNYPPFLVSEVDEETGEATLELPEAVWVVTIKLLTPGMAYQRFSDEAEKFNAIEGTYNNQDSNVTIKYLFKHALKFTILIAEATGQGTAKVSFLAYMKVWEVLDQQEHLDDTIQAILRGLNCIGGVVDTASQASSSMLPTAMNGSKESIDGILQLLEDVSLYMYNRLAKNNLAPVSLREEGPNVYDVEAYISRLNDLQQSFYASWLPAVATPTDVSNEDEEHLEPLQQDQTYVAARTIDPYDTLRLLRPMDPSGYDPCSACMDGTRTALLARIMTWTQNRDSTERLMWISGQAGMGKTSVANSLCERLDSVRALAGSFFCQHDNPDSSNPLWLINNLVHAMAMRIPAYAQEVAYAIRSNRHLCNAHLSLRYDGLIKKPLTRLRSLSTRAIYVIVLDALDEYGDSSSRVKILHYLNDISRTVSWLKIIVTARPTSDIQGFFEENLPGGPITRLQDFDASEDIRAYIKSQITRLAEKERWPSDSITKLCSMSHGIFLWAVQAIKYIKKSAFPALPRVRKVLSGQKSPVTDHFDALFSSALATAMDDDEDEIKDAFLRCIGAILAISDREPLSTPELQSLLQAASGIDSVTLEQTIINLSPLLFVMGGQRIRFHHPSFKNFITSASRSGQFHIRLDQYQAEPAAFCLRILQRDLKFNICQLESSNRLNSKVPDLKHRIDSYIGLTLRYACTHWIDHFIASPSQVLVQEIKLLMKGPPLMYWIEVLSLLSRIDVAIAGLFKLSTLQLNDISGRDLNLVKLWAKDAHRFILSFYDPITTSTPHLYVSALAFAPQRSLTATRMRPHFPNTISTTRGGDSNWHPCIKAIVHPSAVQTLSISPDGGRIIAGYLDGLLAIWNLQTGAFVSKSAVSHRDVVSCVSFSPDGTTIASSSHDTTIHIWDASRDLQNFNVLSGHSGPVHSIAFSPNGSLIASGSSDRTIRLWDVSTSNQIHGAYVGHSSRITSVAFSPDGKRLVSGSWDRTIGVWSVDVRDSRLSDTPLVITGNSDSVTCVVFSPDGSRVASGSVDKTIRMWDSRTGTKYEQRSSSAKHLDTVTSIAFSPDGKCIASCSLDGEIRLWDATTLNAYSKQFGHRSPVNAVSFSPDGCHIVSGSTDMTTRIWEIDVCPKPMATKTLVGHSGYVYSVAITSNGTRIVSGSHNNTVRIWDAQTGAPVGGPLTGHSHNVYSVAVSPNRGWFVSVSGDESMKLWDIATRANINSYKHGSAIYCAAFSPDGAKIAFCSSDNKVYLWDVKAWRMIKDGLQGHSSTVHSVAFSPDGTYLASASADKTVVLWDVDSHSRSSTPLSGHTSTVRSVAFSPCGTQIVSGGEDYTVRVWDIRSGSTVHTLTGHTNDIYAAAFSPDGSRIASGSWDDTLRLWNAITGQPIGQPLTGHSNDVRSVIFSPDGDYLISGADDRTIRVWDISKSYLAVEPETQPPEAFRWPASPYELKSHPDHPGWVSHDQKSHVFWLPAHYERREMFLELGQRNPSSPVYLNYSKFVHGTEWTKTARDLIGNRSE
ncbi:Vegetative incompatibility protein HET-E-1 [Podospora anserina] [Rhizoctonia solani]|uniref:Vegetative incompatibility protein HET-E-1 [Podospora anserina] n=1 Tax=Rhizoctonia solani TaxID=456999 RepID=A0A0K6FNX6_9AGAM|nr:Vegetative incompatibility protein HET-E-1 [Podospora anserina] [Rhizoctonia solani]